MNNLELVCLYINLELVCLYISIQTQNNMRTLSNNTSMGYQAKYHKKN